MFSGIYYAQKKVSNQWVPTTTVYRGDVYRYWNPWAKKPASLDIVASDDLKIEEPLAVDHSCEVCNKTDLLDDMKVFSLPTGETSIYCKDCYGWLVRMARDDYVKSKS